MSPSALKQKAARHYAERLEQLPVGLAANDNIDLKEKFPPFRISDTRSQPTSSRSL
jgi:hypothetical protein